MDILLGILMSAIMPVGLLIIISATARTIHYVFFEKYFKLTFEHAPVWSLFYFSFWTAVVVFLFPEEIRLLFAQVSLFGYFNLVLFLLVVFPTVYRILRASIGNPTWLAKLFPEQGMLSLEERYIVAKIGDVVFQQCLAGAVILILAGRGLEYQQIVVVFLVLFVLAHIYLFRTSGFIWGMHYSTYAALGGFSFPFLVLFVPAGIAYGIILHMLFYVLSAAFFAKLPYPNTAINREIVGVSSIKTKIV